MEPDKKNNSSAAVECQTNTWHAEVMLSSHTWQDPHDLRTPRKERPYTKLTHYHALVIGIRESEATVSHLPACMIHAKDNDDVESVYVKWTITSPTPFIVLVYRSNHPNPPHPSARVVCARNYTMEEVSTNWDPQIFRLDQLVHGIDDEWVSLQELSLRIGIEADELLSFYADFSPSTPEKTEEPLSENRANVPVMLGSCNPETIYRVYQKGIPDWFTETEELYGEDKAFLNSSCQKLHKATLVLVPMSFAKIVVLLHRFGFRPKTPIQTAFVIDAPVISPPKVSLPRLSNEDLRKITPFELILDEECTESRFRTTALMISQGEQAGWSTAYPMDDDPHTMLRQYWDFERRDFKCPTTGLYFMVAVCHWSQVGQDITTNPYCGLLGVFDSKVINPRKNTNGAKALYWFWPNRVRRIVPSGSAGSFCPNDLPLEVRNKITSFLVSLGYSPD